LVRAGYRVLAIDTPGFGYSDPPPDEVLRRPAELPRMVADHLDRVLDTFDVSSCSVIGHSLGGAYASLLAIEHPGRVERLVLAAPAIGPHVGSGLRLLSLTSARLALPPSTTLVRWSFSELAHSVEAIDDEEIEEVVRTLARPQVRRFLVDVLKAGLGPRGIRRELLLLPRLPELKAPTLLLWGRHDRIIPIRNADEFLVRLPEARLEVFERSGHMMFLEELDHFNAAVLAFLEAAPA
jgi:4,5:9,10-diseco-3-hydroxy-5,9,17-trioxoandrosta-1(10),2-diene-4-oate hydrolase